MKKYDYKVFSQILCRHRWIALSWMDPTARTKCLHVDMDRAHLNMFFFPFLTMVSLILFGNFTIHYYTWYIPLVIFCGFLHVWVRSSFSYASMIFSLFYLLFAKQRVDEIQTRVTRTTSGCRESALSIRPRRPYPHLNMLKIFDLFIINGKRCQSLKNI